MADKKISALTAASTPLAGTEVLPIVQSGATVKASVENVLTSAQPSGTANTVAYLNGSKQLSYSGNLGFDGSTLTFGVGGGAKLLAFNSQIIASVNTAGSAYTDLTFDANDFIVRTGVGGATESLRVSDTGNVTNARGNLIIGTAGKGIDFSANANAPGMTSELLNWYEEGTWTPTISSASGTITLVSGANSTYTRVGRFVHVTATIGMTTNASVGTSDITISGLPFTVGTYGIGNLANSNYSSSDFGTGGAHGFLKVTGTSAIHLNRTVDISGRGSTFYWTYNFIYAVS